MKLHPRWILRRDLEEISAIEQASFEFPWSEREIVSALREPHAIGLVAESCEKLGGIVRGFVMYHLGSRSLSIINLAVDPAMRRHGVGRFLINHMKAKLGERRRHTIETRVRERNVGAQLFFRDCGFRAVETLVGYYDDTDEAAYRFEYTSWTASSPVRNQAMRPK